MIDAGFIGEEVDALIKRYENMYPQSTLLRNKRSDLVEAFIKLYNLGWLTRDHEVDIHTTLLRSVNRHDVQAKKLDNTDGKDYIQDVLVAYGDEVGGFLLHSNQSIFKICNHHSQKFSDLISHYETDST
jgi:hypothetical protein